MSDTSNAAVSQGSTAGAAASNATVSQASAAGAATPAVVLTAGVSTVSADEQKAESFFDKHKTLILVVAGILAVVVFVAILVP